MTRRKISAQLDSEIAASLARTLFKKLRSGESVVLFNTLKNAPIRIDWSAAFGGTLRSLNTRGDERIVFMSQTKLLMWLREALVNKILKLASTPT